MRRVLIAFVTALALVTTAGLFVDGADARASGVPRSASLPAAERTQSAPVPAPDPAPQPPPISDETYVVQPGDWLALIADEQGVTIADILRLNPEVTAPDYLIHPGQLLILRGAAEDEAPAPAPVLSSGAVPAAPPVGGEDEDAGVAEASSASVTIEEPEDAATEPASQPTSVPEPPPAAEDPSSAGASGLFTDIGIGIAGLATGITLAAGGPWLRRRRRGY